MKNKILFFILIALTVCSCDDYLDIKPKGKIIPSKIDDYNLILNYNPVSIDQDLLFHSADDFKSSVGQLGDISNPNNTKVKMYTWDSELFLSEEQVDLWNEPYENIYNCNFVIDEIDEAIGDDPLAKLRIKAEARVLRAYEYYLLVNSFAPQYDMITASNDLGVPLITTANVNGKRNYDRESVQEVYDFIIKELTESIVDLPNKAIGISRPSKAAGYGILARVYLQIGNYEKAKENANLAIEKGTDKSLGDYTDTDGDLGSIYNNEQFMVKYFRQSRGFRDGYLSNDLLALFDLDNDSRFGYESIWTEQIDEYYDEDLDDWVEIYTGEYGIAWTVYMNNCVSVPEMLLIRAECNARSSSGSINDVLSDINLLRRNRIFDYVDIESSEINDQESLLLLVLENRRMEMAVTGLRWFDLKRLNKESAYAKTITHILNEEVYELLPNSNKYIFPIPPKVLNIYPNMKQYPRD